MKSWRKYDRCCHRYSISIASNEKIRHIETIEESRHQMPSNGSRRQAHYVIYLHDSGYELYGPIGSEIEKYNGSLFSKGSIQQEHESKTDTLHGDVFARSLISRLFKESRTCTPKTSKSTLYDQIGLKQLLLSTNVDVFTTTI